MKQLLLPLLISLSIYFTFSSCQTTEPCISRIEYRSAPIDVDIDSLFSPITAAEKFKVKSLWTNFNASSSHISVIDSYYILPNRKVHIIGHNAEDRLHYGAIIEPLNYDTSKSYPLLSFLPGLSQTSPYVGIEERWLINGLIKPLQGHWIIIPSFRGQALVTRNGSYCSDGFFGDAYTGATDDALRLLDIVLNIYNSQIDIDKIYSYGISRGGTVALLMGIRQSLINKVIVQSAPYLFHDIDPYERYGWQFSYQFLNTEKSIPELRIPMILSSPFYFIDQYEGTLYIIHGAEDQICPINNVKKIQETYSTRSNTIFDIRTGGHMQSGWKQVLLWIKE